MKGHLLRSLAFVAPATTLYAVALPALALLLDRRFGLGWSLPKELRAVAALLLTLGLALSVWSAGLLTFRGQGTPNPMRPPAKLVIRGPYRWTRNPLMIGGWVFGLGLGLALGSTTLLGIYAAVVAIGIVYVRRVEEPRMLERFGESYRSYAARVPRWLMIVVALCAIPGAVAAQPGGSARTVPPDPASTVVAKIKFEAGAQARWIEAFERHIVPAILDAIEAGDEIMDVTYHESVIPGQDYDFLLVFRGKSFDFYDQRRLAPHYAALFRRVGVEEGRRIIAEMAEWEASVTVTLVRSYRLGP